MAMLLARPSHVAPVVTQSPPPAPATGEPAQPQPVVTPLEPPSGAVAVQPTPTRDVLPPRRIARPHAKVNKVVNVTPRHHLVRQTAEHVQAKFGTGNSEYRRF